MKKTSLIKNMSVHDARSFAKLYDEISSDWELKAEQLQNRRWRKLKHDSN